MAFQNFFATKLYSDIGTSDTTITLDKAPTATAGRLVLEARNPTQREAISYTGVSGNQITGVTRGIGGTTAKSHLKTALVEMNAMAEDLQDLYDAYNNFLAVNNTGWVDTLDTFTYAGNNGNKEFLVTVPGDKTAKYQPGQKLRISRVGTTPTTCADFERSLSQYASKASPVGITFTDDYTCEAWVKLESYGAGSHLTIVSRRTGIITGWQFRLLETGQLSITGAVSGSQFKDYISYQAVPLGVWTHVAASLDLSGNAGATYINGVLVGGTMAATGAPTALTQSGDLMIGGYTGGNELFDGQISEVRVWNTIRTQQQIRDNMAKQLTAPAGLVGNWHLTETSGTTFADSTANANNLTATSSLSLNFKDNPFRAVEYGIVLKPTYNGTSLTTLNVFTGNDNNIPNDTLGSVQYSIQDSPLGFPRDKTKWAVESIFFRIDGVALGAGQWANWLPNSSAYLVVPSGVWELGYSGALFISRGANNSGWYGATLSTTNNTEGDKRFISGGVHTSNVSTISQMTPINVSDTVTTTTPTTYYLNVWSELGGASLSFGGPGFITKITARCPYL